MKVLIFEPWHSGHRYDYLRRVIPPLHGLGVDVTVVSSQVGFSSPEFQIHLRTLESLFRKEECPLPTVGRKMQSRLQLRRQLNHLMLGGAADHIYIPSADTVADILPFLSPGVFRKLPFLEGLHLFGGFGYPRSTWQDVLKGGFSGLIASRAPWSVYAHLDPWQLEALCRRYPSLRRKALVMPDPVDPPIDITRQAARQDLGIPVDGVYLGSAGPMNRRKGIDLLLRAFSDAAKRLPATARLLLAGPLEPELRQMIQQESIGMLTRERMVVIDRRLSPREMSIVIPAMDIVCTPYPHHVGSSGIALRAAASHRPLLANDRYWLKNVVETLGLGQTCPVLHHEAFVQGILSAFQACQAYRHPKRAERFLQFHSHDNFVATWTQHLRRRVGLSPDPQRMAWSWEMLHD